MTLFPVLNETETKKKAREVLKSYRSLNRRSGGTASIQSPQFSDMPRGSSGGNGSEHAILKRLKDINKNSLDIYRESQYKLYAIYQAMQCISTISFEILRLSYCVADPYSVIKIANTLKVYRFNDYGIEEQITYSDKNIEVLKSKALIEFAEAYQYENLLVYEN